MPADSRRLSILTAREIEDLYGLPCFTEDDRLRYFDLRGCWKTPSSEPSDQEMDH